MGNVHISSNIPRPSFSCGVARSLAQGYWLLIFKKDAIPVSPIVVKLDDNPEHDL